MLITLDLDGATLHAVENYMVILIRKTALNGMPGYPGMISYMITCCSRGLKRHRKPSIVTTHNHPEPDNLERCNLSQNDRLRAVSDWDKELR